MVKVQLHKNQDLFLQWLLNYHSKYLNTEIVLLVRSTVSNGEYPEGGAISSEFNYLLQSYKLEYINYRKLTKKPPTVVIPHSRKFK